MVIKLYTAELTPSVHAVMMACAIFNVPFEKKQLNLMAKQNMTEEFSEKNPLHTVPVLEDNDFILRDSQTMLMYLADTYGNADDDSWYPRETKKRALVNQQLFFDTGILFPKLRNLTYSLIMERRHKLSQNIIQSIEEAYGYIEEFLFKSTYIAIDNITIADLAVYSNVSFFVCAVPLDARKFPKTFQWVKEMEEQPYSREHNKPEADAFADLIKQCQELDTPQTSTGRRPGSTRPQK